MALKIEYEKAQEWYQKVENSEVISKSDAVSDILHGIDLVEKASLFSKNEEVDDISTSSLKYLELHYYLAKVFGSERDLTLRRKSLHDSVIYYQTFIQKCILYKIVTEAELEKLGLLESTEEDRGNTVFQRLQSGSGGFMTSATAYSNTVGSNTIDLEKKRMFKIAKFKRERELKNKISSLRRLIKSVTANSVKSSSYDNQGSTETENEIGAAVNSDMEDRVTSSTLTAASSDGLDEDGDFEVELRDMQLCQLQSYVLESYDNIASCNQEIDMLAHMDSLAREQEDRKVQSKTALYREGKSSSSRDEQQQGPEGTDERMKQIERFGRELPSLPPQDHEGATGELEYTTVNKNVEGKLIMNRANIKDKVFEPSMSAPTLSLEEFADREMARAMEAQQAQQDAPVGTRRYSELVAAGEEDNEELVDAACLKDRDWDDWKDDNKKGSGNKANKRF